jgi:ferredoxin
MEVVMKVVVDKAVCIGCGLCASSCPAVYEMEDNVAIVIADPVPSQEEANAKQAAKDCPVDAISVQ